MAGLALVTTPTYSDESNDNPRAGDPRLLVFLRASVETVGRETAIVIREISRSSMLFVSDASPKAGAAILIKRGGWSCFGIVVDVLDKGYLVHFDEPLSDQDLANALNRSPATPVAVPSYKRPGFRMSRHPAHENELANAWVWPRHVRHSSSARG
jgi:hypothetical protein